MDELFAGEIKTILKKDTVLDEKDLERYWLWNNQTTEMDTYVLPNTAHLNIAYNGKPGYVTESLAETGADGVERPVRIIAALSQEAFKAPVEISQTVTLNFATGGLRISEETDLDLYFHEISGAWLMKQLNDGFFRFVDENEKVLELAEAGQEGSVKFFWVGKSDKEAQDPNEPLYILTLDTETDEADLFLTSAAMLEAEKDPVNVSVLLYRDSKSDRRGEVLFNISMYATENPESSDLFEVLNDLKEEREIDTPESLTVILRPYHVPGCTGGAYVITDHVFALDDATDGKVSMYDGGFEATFDGDVYDSPYIRVEGVSTGELIITIKGGQPIYADLKKPKTAQDLNGGNYSLTEDGWTDEDGNLIN